VYRIMLFQEGLYEQIRAIARGNIGLYQRKSATSGKAGGLKKVEPLKAVRL
jgi:hypothetical protein